MRIRRKKHLEERINSVSDILFIADFDIPNSTLANQDKKYFDFNKILLSGSLIGCFLSLILFSFISSDICDSFEY